MKLNYFSSQTVPKENARGRNGLPSMTIVKNGSFFFNNEAVNQIGIKNDSKITIAQDEEHPENWYVFLDESNGFGLRVDEKKKTAAFGHASLADLIFEAFGLVRDHTLKFRVCGEATMIGKSPTKYWGIIKRD